MEELIMSNTYNRKDSDLLGLKHIPSDPNQKNNLAENTKKVAENQNLNNSKKKLLFTEQDYLDESINEKIRIFNEMKKEERELRLQNMNNEADELKNEASSLASDIYSDRASIIYSEEELTDNEKRLLLNAYQNEDIALHGMKRYNNYYDDEYGDEEYSRVIAPLELNCTRQYKIHSVEDVYNFVKNTSSKYQYDGTKIAPGDILHAVTFECANNLSLLVDGRHFTFDSSPFSLTNVIEFSIFTPKKIFDEILKKYTIDESIYMMSLVTPDIKLSRKILNGVTSPHGTIVHHFDFPKLYEDNQLGDPLAKQCEFKLRWVDEDNSPQKALTITSFFKPEKDLWSLESSGEIRTIWALP